MTELQGMVVPASFMGFHVTGFDFTQIMNCNFVVLDMGQPGDGDKLALGVQKTHEAGLPCFALQEIDAVDLHADWSNGGFKYFEHWATNIVSKTLHGAFLRITNVTDAKGSDLSPVVFASLLERLLDDWRDGTETIPPHDNEDPRLNRDNIMLMLDKEIVSKYVDDPDENVQTKLSRELLLAPCDNYRNFDNGVLLRSDMDVIGNHYASLTLIGLDGEPHSKQDSLFAQQPFAHLWAENSYQTKSVSLSNGGDGIVGAMTYYGSLADLEGFTNMTINVNKEIPTEPDPDPEPTPEFSNFGLDISRHQGELDWDTIATHDPMVEFVAIRAGVSWGYEDGQFATNWQQSHERDIPVGAYHVLYPDQSIYDQVGNLRAIINDVGLGNGQLPIIADIEVHRLQTPMQVAIAAESYLTEIERVFGRKPIIYTAKWFMDGYVDPSFINKMGDRYLWWIANYPTGYGNWQPDDPGEPPFPLLPTGLDPERVIIHQYSETGTAIGGTSSSMDYNRWLKLSEMFFELTGTEPTEPEPPAPDCDNCVYKQQVEAVQDIVCGGE